jgi:hypothetical protein
MTSPVTKITDYQQRLRDDMLTQFHNDPVHTAIADAISLEYQRFENVAYDVLDKNLLNNSVGLILDNIWGKIARVDRLGRSDDDYRKIIQVAIAASDSDGGAEDIIWIASQLVGASVRYLQEGEAFFTLQYEAAPDAPMSADLQAEALELIGRAVPAGVAWRLIWGSDVNTGIYDEDTYGTGRYGARIGGAP